MSHKSAVMTWIIVLYTIYIFIGSIINYYNTNNKNVCIELEIIFVWYIFKKIVIYYYYYKIGNKYNIIFIN